MNEFGPAELAIILIAALLYLAPFWKIFSKAGFPGPLSLCMAVPVLNLIILYYVAFARWPAHKQSDRASPPFEPIHPS